MLKRIYQTSTMFLLSVVLLLTSCSKGFYVNIPRPSELNLQKYKNACITPFQNPSHVNEAINLAVGLLTNSGVEVPFLTSGDDLSFLLSNRFVESKKFVLIDKAKLNSGDVSLVNTTFLIEGQVSICSFRDMGTRETGRSKNSNGITVVSYERIGKMNFVVTMKVIDAATSNVVMVRTIDASRDYAVSNSGYPPAPFNTNAIFSERKQFVTEAMSRICLPYMITKYVDFEKDKAFEEDLNTSINEFKIGNVDNAIKILQNVSQRNDFLPKTKAKALYNYGKILVYTGYPEDAVPVLEDATRLSNYSSDYTRMLSEAKSEREVVRKLRAQQN